VGIGGKLWPTNVPKLMTSFVIVISFVRGGFMKLRCHCDFVEVFHPSFCQYYNGILCFCQICCQFTSVLYMFWSEYKFFILCFLVTKAKKTRK